MKAIVFSSYIPTIESLKVGEEFLELFKSYFNEYDIYIGINTGSINERENMIQSYGEVLHIYYGTVEKELCIDSDISGFQKALEIMKDNGKSYDIVRFGHTKGVTSNRDNIRKDIIENFFKEKNKIEKYFDDSKLGIFGRYITTNVDINDIDDRLGQIKEYKYESAKIFYLYTFYTIKGRIIKDFIENCDKNFFKKNLKTHYKFDRYFFEDDFPNIPTRYGYDFKYDIITHHPIRNINFKKKLQLYSDLRFNKSLKNIIMLYIIKVLNKLMWIFYKIIEYILPKKTINRIKKTLVHLFHKI